MDCAASLLLNPLCVPTLQGWGSFPALVGVDGAREAPHVPGADVDTVLLSAVPSFPLEIHLGRRMVMEEKQLFFPSIKKEIPNLMAQHMLNCPKKRGIRAAGNKTCQQ